MGCRKISNVSGMCWGGHGSAWAQFPKKIYTQKANGRRERQPQNQKSHHTTGGVNTNPKTNKSILSDNCKDFAHHRINDATCEFANPRANHVVGSSLLATNGFLWRDSWISPDWEKNGTDKLEVEV